ncbi:DNA polymerase sliding clamp subunit (PcnA homolog) [gamma proteobacterium HdN1]|nr:DNA polymerase sliding clamp subunit (PcnA homolog) [gamma proteobacterium HdN1]
MKFKVIREGILKPLQQLAGLVERRQTKPILANILLVLDGNALTLTGTDTEVELRARIQLGEEYPFGRATLPAKKLLDICKSLPEGAELLIEADDQKALLRSGRSKFSLVALPPDDFPDLEDGQFEVQFSIQQRYLRELIEKTGFAMAQQDVRFYLNGMLLEVSENNLRAVATDGHRLALGDRDILWQGAGIRQAVVPRKGILEIPKLFGSDDGELLISLSGNHLRAETADLRFTSKLLDAKYPEYGRVLPKPGERYIVADRDALRQCLLRVGILSNEKFRGVRLTFQCGVLVARASNPEQEEAEESVVVDYNGADTEIAFNIGYLLDVLGVVKSESVSISLADANNTALIRETVDDKTLYVVMPMRI